ncbi:sporulation initiation factor Spo0A C-terminal domain-containing protein [Eubacteriales bacterium KG127]
MDIKIGLAIHDENLKKQLLEFFSKKNNYQIIFLAENGKRTTECLCRYSIDILLIESILSYINGTEIIIDLYKGNVYPIKPAFILISDIQSHVNIIQHMDLEYVSFILKPVYLNYLDKEINRLLKYKAGVLPCQERRDIRKKQTSSNYHKIHNMEKLVNEILCDLGIGHKYKGSNYLKDAILLSIFKSDMWDFELKPILFELSNYYKRHTTSIISLIGKTIIKINKNDSKYYNLIFSKKKDCENKITAKEFILAIAEYVRLEVN